MAQQKFTERPKGKDYCLVSSNVGRNDPRTNCSPVVLPHGVSLKLWGSCSSRVFLVTCFPNLSKDLCASWRGLMFLSERFCFQTQVPRCWSCISCLVLCAKGMRNALLILLCQRSDGCRHSRKSTCTCSKTPILQPPKHIFFAFFKKISLYVGLITYSTKECDSIMDGSLPADKKFA